MFRSRLFRSPDLNGGAGGAPAGGDPEAAKPEGGAGGAETFTAEEVEGLIKKRTAQLLKNLPGKLVAGDPKFAAIRDALLESDDFAAAVAEKKGLGKTPAKGERGSATLDDKAVTQLQTEWTKKFLEPLTQKAQQLEETVSSLSEGYVRAELTQALVPAGYEQDEDLVEVILSKHGKSLVYSTEYRQVVILNEDGEVAVDVRNRPKTVKAFIADCKAKGLFPRWHADQGRKVPGGKPGDGSKRDMSTMSSAEKIALGLRTRK